MANRQGRRWVRRLLAGLAVLALILIGLLWRGSYFDRDPYEAMAATGPAHGDVAALYLSGDMGLRFGPGDTMADLLAARGIPVIGFNTPVAFRARRTAAETDAIIADAVRTALAASHAERLVLIGRSFGADVLAAALPALPENLRHRVAAVVLIVPGRHVFFRADPSNITYLGTPDSDARRGIGAITWAPLVCIHGAEEADSACAGITQPNVTNIAMPGGHFLDFDTAAITRNVMSALARVTALPMRGSGGRG
ncbi:AcvB/VirJ family lysyl-phosphatidylglycerol hydrolase [uncultured Sphingomonas sp.]|uniref:AcvB/VirJ family lysyl-phosphatidylglycerol hydrolase n=1 Tax=uncultured Sphingomonas sp. TaxID=158754 RepID=UPI002627EE21|nr:AcvB/VirJ family lysyl-phosphatidylglycerol hydrolase [uncultured Sphingomonas sp.]